MPLITAKSVSGLLDGFDAVGLDTAVMLRHLGVSRQYFSEPYTMVPRAWVDELYEIAFRQDSRSDLPACVGSHTPFGAFGLLDYLIGSADTLGNGLSALALSFHLIYSTVRIELDHSNGDALWLVHRSFTATNWIIDTWSLGIMIERMSRYCRQFRVRDVYIAGLENTPTAAFEAIYNAPVHINARYSGLCLVDGIQNARFETADPALYMTLKNLAQSVEVKAFQTAPFAYLVRTQLAQALPEGKFSVGDMADRLGLPLRTFQRRMSGERVSFHDLLDSYRHDLAIKLLLRPNTKISDVARALGYNEQSSFNRAFRRWTSETPRAWLGRNAIQQAS